MIVLLGCPRMTRPARLVTLCISTLCACNGGGGADDEVAETGSTGESTTEVSTFESSGDEPTSGSTEATEGSEVESSGTETSDSESTSSDSESSGTETSGSESSGSESTSSGSESTSSDTSSSSSDTMSSSDTTSSSDTQGESGGDLAPFVIDVGPSDGLLGVAKASNVTITFSEAMDGATLTTNTADTSCTGSVQVSADDFATCVRMTAQPSSNDDLTFTLDPLAPLASAATYRVRVLASASDMQGTPLDADFESAGFTVRYYHTITIDGTNDFTADETFTSSTLGHVGYVAWDETYLYLGMGSPDLQGNSTQVFWVAYLGGMPSSNAGVTYNTQQPQLPFGAHVHLRYKASDDFGGGLQWNGNAWVGAGFGPVVGSNDVAAAGSFFETRVAWANLGNPDALELHMGMLREQAFNEASWAAIPSNSYVDAYDPNYAHYFEFDVIGSTLPNDHAPL